MELKPNWLTKKELNKEINILDVFDDIEKSYKKLKDKIYISDKVSISKKDSNKKIETLSIIVSKLSIINLFYNNNNINNNELYK